jgi:serine/threonine-protein kinase
MSSAVTKDPLLGRTIAQRYRLISRLGAGAVAAVYLARHVLIDRLSAIKIVHPELVRDPVYRERILREARAVNRINHPNIVEISDYGEADGFVFLVMEYVPGESLEQALGRGPLGWRRAAAIGLQVASALGRAHQMGVVHRDLKPANILVVARRDGGDMVKLTDFGVAKLADDAPMTLRIGAPSGGWAYAAPEQQGRESIDARTDLYALGVVLYEAAAGALPSSEPGAPMEPLSVRAPDTPAFFEEVISTLLAPRPEDRPRDGFEAADLLRRALEREVALAVTIPPLSSEPPTPSRRQLSIPEISIPPSGSRRAHLVGAPFDRLGSICAAALSTLEERFDGGEGAPLDPRAEAALDEARKLCTTVQAVGDLVASDSRALEAVQARGRAARAELGKRLDEVAREHSRALGWAGTIAERSYLVEAQRLSGEHPVPAVEAMVWEQAALEQEEDRVRERAAQLAAKMRACQAEIERQNERLEHELLVVNACLEGRIAALRSLAVEAWMALEGAAAHAGVPEEALRAAR